MLVSVTKSILASMDDKSLIWTCIGPTIMQIRGKSFKVKTEGTAELNEGQKALLMFQVLYGHSVGGVLELLSHLSYLMLEKGFWTEMKKGIRYFGDHELLHLMDKIELLYNSINTDNADVHQPEGHKYSGIDSDIHPSAIDKQLHELMPKSIEIVGSYIRSHTGEFMLIADGGV